ncbi:peptidase A24 [Paenibacillus darwinianus]|uniref:Peptidase A24 n=1 Tax=Paenibacillus darwinianus TaxID=1380763 RepID=A0A9W5W839_9BACL|nr:A24 family peptidase [Paenibacillus darwinianus]EXX89658.1 peptidase A24 [Paenibacillus darwinianus]EXX89968.1 peptidase A24 [Paenibacillus darwinianus]EXX90228.1 peptidase A24 [Paenibacillus darwinianus]
MAFAEVGAVVLLSVAFVFDIRYMTIPNRLTVTSFAGGCVYQALAGGWPGLTSAIYGAAVGFFVILLLYGLKAVGAGDVKLFGALGAWVGPSEVWYCAVYAVMIAGVYGIVLLTLRRPFLRRRLAQRPTLPAAWIVLDEETGLPSGRLRFPFMLAVAPAAAALWFL